MKTLTDFDEKFEESDSMSDFVVTITEETDTGSAAFNCAISMIARKPFDDIGVGKATVRSAIVDCYDTTSSTLSNLESEHGDLPTCAKIADGRTEQLVEKDDMQLAELYRAVRNIREGNRGAESFLKSSLGSYREPQWITHALLGKDGMSFGVGVKSVVNALESEYGPYDTRRGRALCPDIRDHAIRAVDPTKNVPQSPEVGTPFLPMLAKSKDLPEDPDEPWVIQPKYDGARIIIHVEEGTIIGAHSRNLNDVTDSLPELDDLEEALPDEGSYILDGEAVAYKDGEKQPFQAIMTRFNREQDIDDQDIDVRFQIFDMVYGRYDPVDGYDGDLSREPLKYRLYLLMWLLPENPEYRVEGTIVQSRDEMVDEFRDFRDQGYEGAIVKSYDGEYEFDRRSPEWRKMVEDAENVDLRINGIIEGEDGNAGSVGALRVETEDGHDLGKVGTGFGEDDGERIWNNRDEIEGKIVEISWRELQENEDGTYGLRFPAFEAIRTDKDEADTLEQVLAQQ